MYDRGAVGPEQTNLRLFPFIILIEVETIEILEMKIYDHICGLLCMNSSMN